jgi:hypothetical protein
MRLRTINNDEKRVLKTLKERGKTSVTTNGSTKVKYIESGNFTIAVVKAGARELYGVAKRNPTDFANSEIGQQLAFSRALQQG